MIFEIDMGYLKENNITAHQYVIAKLATDGELKILKSYVTMTSSFEELPRDLKNLYNQGFLVENPTDEATFSNIKVSDKFIKTHSFTDDPFEEFFNTFPIKVLRPDGNYDYLRVDRERSKKLYHNIIHMNLSKHNFIIRCLKEEIRDKTLKSQLSFMKRMPTWLTSESWKVYADRIEEDSVSTKEGKIVGYGQDIE